MLSTRNKGICLSLLIFLILFFVTFHYASNAVPSIYSSDEQDAFVLAKKLVSEQPLSPEIKAEIHTFLPKPLIIPLASVLYYFGLLKFWFIVPFFFYFLGVISLFLYLKDKLNNKILSYGAAFFLIFNSLYWYYGTQFIPDTIVAGSLMAMVYFLDHSFNYSKSYHRLFILLASFFGTLAFLFRIEVLPVIFVGFFVFLISKTGFKIKDPLFYKPLFLFYSLSFFLSSVFFILYLFAFEGHLFLFTFPLELLKRTLNNCLF